MDSIDDISLLYRRFEFDKERVRVDVNFSQIHEALNENSDSNEGAEADDTENEVALRKPFSKNSKDVPDTSWFHKALVICDLQPFPIPHPLRQQIRADVQQGLFDEETNRGRHAGSWLLHEAMKRRGR